MKNKHYKIMKTNIKNGIYIIDEQGDLHTMEDWAVSPNSESAQCVALVAGQTRLLISKKNLEEQTFDDAQKSAAKVTLCGNTCRCAARKESHDIYDARFRGLDEAMQLIGGDPLTNSYWTCEADPDPEYYVNTAFIYGGFYGTVFTNRKYYSNSVRPLAEF
jgi:hypothetical protein